MTAMNYVRHLAGGGVVAARFGQALPPTGTAARVPRSLAFRPLRRRGQALRSLRRPSCRWWWGFCTT